MQIANLRIGGFAGIENKFVDYELVTRVVTAAWAGGELDEATALSLSSVAQGDGETQRDGRRMEILSVHIKGFVILVAQEAAAAPINGQAIRLVLVLDKQTNGAQLNAEDVFTTTTTDVNAWRNLQHSQRFRILKDVRIDLMPWGGTAGGTNSFDRGETKVLFEIHKVFKKPITVNHTGTTAVVASIADNSLHLIGVSTSATACAVSYVSRVRFRG